MGPRAERAHRIDPDAAATANESARSGSRLERDFGPVTQRHELALREVLTVLDAVVLLLSAAAAYEIRRWWPGPASLQAWQEYAWLLWVILPTWLLLLRWSGLHDSAQFRPLAAPFARLARAHALASLVLLSSVFSAGPVGVSRILIQVFIAVSFVGLAGLRFGARRRLRSLERVAESNRTHVLIVGSGPRVNDYVETLRAHPHWPLRVLGVVSPRPQPSSTPVLGTLADLPALLAEQVVDEVVFVSNGGDEENVETVAAICAERGVPFRILVRMPQACAGSFRVERIGDGLVLLSDEAVRSDLLAAAVKRAIDIVGSIVGLIACAPVALWYWRKLYRESPGPLLFQQVRVGQNGRLFHLYKFRTMDVDAERRLPELMARNEMKGQIFKLRDDPRVTLTGRWLRRTHLDELPQFWNVLIGDMSLVGTRPPTPSEVDQYQPHHHRRLSSKPGITGFWQLEGNKGIDNFEEVVRLDWEYLTRRSIWLDFSILLRTVGKMIRSEGW